MDKNPDFDAFTDGPWYIYENWGEDGDERHRKPMAIIGDYYVDPGLHHHLGGSYKDANLISLTPQLYHKIDQLAHSLYWEIESKYPQEMRAYPHNQAKYEADIQEVYDAWELLRKAWKGEDDD